MMIQFTRNSFKTPAILLGVLALTSGLSCAVVPESNDAQAVVPEVVSAPPAGADLHGAYSNFQRRDFAAASSGFRSISDDGGNSSRDRQLALLGQTLVYLSTDAEWRDLSEAGNTLQSAEGITVESGNVETEMLMNALSSLIGVETNISELNTKVANSSTEITSLKGDLESAVAEQDALNEALEKLKALTIGN